MSDIKDTITVEINGRPRDLTMTFGLLNEISTMVGELDKVTNIAIDPVLRGQILRSVLAERDVNGNIAPDWKLSDVNMSKDTTANIIEWAMDHVMDFFLKMVKIIQNLDKKHETVLKGLMSSSPGRRR